MKKNTIITAMFLLSILLILKTNTIQSQVRGNGNVQSQVRNVENFSGIQSGSSIDLFISQGSTISVKIVADENLLEYIKTSVSNDVLTIDITKNIMDASKLEVYITMNNLKSLQQNGSGDAQIRGPISGSDISIQLNGSGDLDAQLSAKNLDLQISGSGDAKFSGVRGNLSISIAGSGDVSATDLQLENCSASVMGSGDVSLSGSSVNLSLEQSGSGDNNSFNLKAVNAEISCSGSGDVVVNVIEKLKARTSGSGDITYTGSPKMVDVESSGSGEVYKK